MDKYYVKKALPVQAVQLASPANIETLEGVMKAEAGDYLITGTHGETYPVKKEIFESNYVLASGAYRNIKGEVSFFRDGLPYKGE